MKTLTSKNQAEKITLKKITFLGKIKMTPIKRQIPFGLIISLE